MKDEQWQDFLEFAGFKSISDLRCMNGKPFWKEPGGDSFHLTELPPQDMNTLDRWIWPKMTTNQRVAVLTIWSPLWGFGFEALADAIWKVVKRA